MDRKEAIEFIKVHYDLSDCNGLKEALETLIPELKESEDERIRKEILEYFQQFENEELRGVKISDWIAWLEKQGEQKSTWSGEDEVMLQDIIKELNSVEHLIDSQGKTQIQSRIDWLNSLKCKFIKRK